MIAFYQSATGFVTMFIATTCFALAPGTMPKKAVAGLAMSLIMIAQNFACFVGPPLLGRVVARGDWAPGGYPMALVLLVGLIGAVVFARIRPEKTQATVRD